MQDMPMVNPALSVEAVGFRPWADHWLGVLVTPWFMNLWLMPRVLAKWQPIGERETRHYVFPAGVFEFIGGRDPALGDYQACSLFSPMFEFSDPANARDTAVAALAALFDRASREAGEAAVDAQARLSPAVRPVSKRDFLFGSAPRGDRGP
jgi:[NiFe] hydrogenase assembly HybE family chaperone